MLVFLLALVGCGQGAPEEIAQENGNDTGDPVTEENGAKELNGEIDEGNDSDTEEGMPSRMPIYPGASFIEIEEDPSGQQFIVVYLYESDDIVEDIYNWYLAKIDASPDYDGVETEYASDEFCKVNGLLYIEQWDDTISDQVQIDSRARENTQLRFIVTHLDRLPGL